MVKWLDQLSRIPSNELFAERMKRWEKIGQWDTISEEEIISFEKPVTYFIPKPKKYSLLPAIKTVSTMLVKKCLIRYCTQSSLPITSPVKYADIGMSG